jgi:hypothetical protein
VSELVEEIVAGGVIAMGSSTSVAGRVGVGSGAETEEWRQRSFVCSFIHSFVHSFIRLFICSFVRLFVHSFIHSFICLFVYNAGRGLQ